MNRKTKLENYKNWLEATQLDHQRNNPEKK